MSQIYLVTGQGQLFDNETYKVISVEESLRLLEPLTIVGVDTETSGLDCHNDKLLSLQLGCFDFQIVIDCLTVNISQYKEFLESDRLFLFWNAKFDLKWLYISNIIPKRVYDGFLAEKLMWLGYPSGMHSMSLKSAGEKYLGIELDKSVRGEIIYRGLNDRTVEYAALDVCYLEKIREKQLEELEKKSLITAIDYENRFVLALSYMEFCGIKLDVDKWQTKMKNDLEKLNLSLSKLNDWVVNYCLSKNKNESLESVSSDEITIGYTPYNDKEYNEYLEDKAKLEAEGCKLIKELPPSSNMGMYTYVYKRPSPIKKTVRHVYVKQELQMNLFEEYDPTPKCVINWNSANQVIPLFEELGFNLIAKDKSTGKMRKSIDAKVIKPQKNISSIAPIYLEYKAAQKVVSTYGQTFLDQVDKKTGRLYSQYSQLGADTGRITSGGKNKSTKEEYINFLNLPSDSVTRSCFIAEKGNKFISIDYSAQESCLLAHIANDPLMLEEINNGSGDIHSLVASLVFKEEIGDTPLTEIKEKFHNLRQIAKGYEFQF